MADAETVETELMIADMESLEKRLTPLQKRFQSGDKTLKADVELMQGALDLLRDGKPARVLDVSKDDRKRFEMLQLLTAKPVLYVCNVAEDDAAEGNEHSATVAEKAAAEGASAIVISAAIESEIAQLTDMEERAMFLEGIGLEETGLDQIINAGYGLLNLLTFFTAGPKESRAWTVRVGAAAPEAAGAIHTDFEKGFIRAETIAYDDYITVGGEQAAKDAGKMRLEGRDYTVQDGDVMHFRFNV